VCADFVCEIFYHSKTSTLCLHVCYIQRILVACQSIKILQTILQQYYYKSITRNDVHKVFIELDGRHTLFIVILRNEEH
jgi:hypothetical protein